MNIKHIKAVFYKELMLLKNKWRSFIVSVSMYFILLTALSLYMYRYDTYNYIRGISMYVQVYTGFVAFMYALRFWEEKVTGTMEIALAGEFKFRELIFIKNLFYLLVGLTSSLLAVIILSLVTKVLNISDIISALILFSVIVFPYGMINAVCMWCYKSGIGKLVQYTSLILMFSSFGLIQSITTDGLNKLFILGMLTVCFIIWIIAILLMSFASKEKAILSEMD